MNRKRVTAIVVAVVVLGLAGAVAITRPWSAWPGFTGATVGPQDPVVAQIGTGAYEPRHMTWHRRMGRPACAEACVPNRNPASSRTTRPVHPFRFANLVIRRT